MTTILEAACKTKDIDPAEVELVEVKDGDLFLHLAGGGVVRIEMSALPAELLGPESDLPTQPLPEHTTMTEPQPTRAQAKAKRKRN